MSLLMTALAGANLIYGVGMVELGITFSYEQLVIDNDIIRMVRRLIEGIPVDDEALAVDVIASVGPGGNFLMEEHTLRHMKREQSQPRILDRTMRYSWEAAGSKDLTQVAREVALEILENHRPEPLPPGVAERLREIIREAEAELCR